MARISPPKAVSARRAKRSRPWPAVFGSVVFESGTRTLRGENVSAFHVASALTLVAGLAGGGNSPLISPFLARAWLAFEVFTGKLCRGTCIRHALP